jgi:hypothetical protein
MRLAVSIFALLLNVMSTRAAFLLTASLGALVVRCGMVRSSTATSAAIALLFLVACAEPPPLYQKAGGTVEDFERSKAHCMGVAEQTVSYRRNDRFYQHTTYEPKTFRVCMQDFAWNQSNAEELIGAVEDSAPYFAGE